MSDVLAFVGVSGLQERDFVLPILIGLFTAALFGGILSNDYVLDAEVILRDNPRVSEGRFGEILKTDWWNRDEDGKTLYRPVSMLFLAVVSQISRSPVAVNGAVLLLHVASLLLRYFFLKRLLRASTTPRLWALMGALVSGVHGFTAEGVVGMVGAAEILMTTLLLGSWWSFDLALRNTSTVGGSRYLWLSLILFVLALLAKENAFGFPLVLGAHALVSTPAGVSRAKSLVPALLIGVAGIGLVVFLRRLVLGEVLAVDRQNVYVGFTSVERVATALKTYGGLYLPKFFWPFTLGPNLTHADVPPTGHFLNGQVLLGAAFWVLLVMGGGILAIKRRPAATGLIFAGALLFPTSNLLVPIGAVAAYRFWYGPIFGLVLAAVLSGSQLFDRRSVAGWMILTGLGLFAVIGTAGSAELTRKWQNSRTLFAHAVQASPHSAWALQNDTYVNSLALGDTTTDQRMAALNRLDVLRPHLPRIPSSGKVEIQSAISFFRLLMNRASFLATTARSVADIEKAQQDCREALTLVEGLDEFVFDGRLNATQLVLAEFEFRSRERSSKDTLINLLVSALALADAAGEFEARVPREKRANLEVMRYRIAQYRLQLEPEALGGETPLTWIEAALKSDPDHVDARLLMADHLRRNNDLAGALSQIEYLHKIQRLSISAADLAMTIERQLNRPAQMAIWQERSKGLSARTPQEAEIQARWRRAGGSSR